jgi:nucleotide-binding universal stress UspA family protein
MTTHTGPVVAGIDGSPQSLAATVWAAREAARRRLGLRLVHGHLQIATPAGFGYPSLPVDVETPMRYGRDMLAHVADDVRRDHPEIPVQAVFTVGGPAGVLVDESRAASLVVVGTRGLGGFAGLLAGSVSTQVAAHAHCPVIVVRTDGASQPGPRAPVVVGLDGSTLSTRALRFALDEAAAGDAPLIAVYAWQALPTGNLGPTTVWHYDRAEAEDEARRLLAEQLAGCAERYPQLSIEPRPVLSFNPGETLVDASRTAGLVVVGSRGRGGFTGLLLGSTSQTLVHHAHCSVAVIHPHLAEGQDSGTATE